ncbi:MAG: acyl-CoA dehydrogenase family protein [Solirubrobacteraceae bacterium]
MDLELTPDQVELRRVAAQVLDRHAPLSLARGMLEGGGDPAELWHALGDLGWYAVGLDEDDPFGVPGLCLLAEQAGRHAAPTLLVDTACAARAARDGGRGGVAARVRAGELTCAFALLEAAGSWDPGAVSATAAPDGTGSRVSGAKLGVHHAESADVLAVVAAGEDGPGLHLVERGAAGVSIAPAVGLDAASAARTVTFDAACAEPVGAGPAALEAALAVAAVATAAEGLGAASAAFDLAVAYSLERVQYGREIGRFQALQHLMAEMHVLRETAWSTAFYAAAAIDEELDGRGEAVHVAKAHAARSARTVAEGAMQVLGGIGFTWEHDHHLLHRRVLECEQRFGDAAFHERRIAATLRQRARSGDEARPAAPATAGRPS